MQILKNMENKNVESNKAMTFCDTASKALNLTMKPRGYIARPKLFPLLSTKWNDDVVLRGNYVFLHKRRFLFFSNFEKRGDQQPPSWICHHLKMKNVNFKKTWLSKSLAMETSSHVIKICHTKKTALR